jgi:long-chain fatty acid transport protein
MATLDQGTAAAGRAALAVDASTAWLNPAGMTRARTVPAPPRGRPIVIQSNFDVEPGTTTSGSCYSPNLIYAVGLNLIWRF